MCEENQTEVKEILLLGFHNLHNLKYLIFILFVLIYTVIMTGNLLIVILVTTTDHLKNIPMFYFLKYLALSDMLLTTSVMPLMLNIIIMDGMTVSFVGCITQLYLFGVSGFVPCFLLAVMSLDRYLAIHHPFRYTLIMNPNVCFQMVCGLWLLVFTFISSENILIGQLHFCGWNDFRLDHFFCDFAPTVQLSTSDTSTLFLVDFFISIIMISVPFVFIVTTYILIFFTILHIRSASGRRKFFSTCSSHLTTVCTYYVTLMVVYMAPSGENSTNVNKFRSLLYIVGTPLVNPIIYSLRNQEIKAALRKGLHYVIKTQ